MSLRSTVVRLRREIERRERAVADSIPLFSPEDIAWIEARAAARGDDLVAFVAATSTDDLRSELREWDRGTAIAVKEWGEPRTGDVLWHGAAKAELARREARQF